MAKTYSDDAKKWMKISKKATASNRATPPVKVGVVVKKTNEESEWYQALVEECKSIITEAVFTSRWSLVEGYWHLGKRIREDILAQEYAKGNKTFVQDLARNLRQKDSDTQQFGGVSERTLYYAIQFFDKYPRLDKVPEGKNISWNKLVTKYLPSPKGKKKCSHKWEVIKRCKMCGIFQRKKP